ncbi:MAG TPA: hypothetical protein VFM42_04965 [Sphingomicrobium sp.]|jgi:hypothetical protein|nr:hypothetical protein [Sphingomicrobium sp.]
MSTRSFGSLFMVASCAAAALGCYLVSLRVASERASLEDVEARIVSTQREVRMLQTEIGTRGRLSQLERWNAGAFALSAPDADQILKGGFELARLIQPRREVDFQAPVVLAAAPAPQRPPIGELADDDSSTTAITPSGLLHEASLKTETREVPAPSAGQMPLPAEPKSADRPVTAAKPAPLKSKDKPGLAAAQSAAKPLKKHASVASDKAAKKSVDKPVIARKKPVTKAVELAKVDPLAPLPDKHSGKTKDSPPGR